MPDFSSTNNIRVEDYLYLVKQIATRLQRTFKRHFELGDLLTVGEDLLMKAIQTYDPNKAAPASRFDAYASERINWGILDWTRKPENREVQISPVFLANRAYEEPVPIDTRIDLKRALARLTEHEREVLRLRFEDGHTQAETAKLLGTHQMGISIVERRAIRIIREKWPQAA